MGGYKILFKKSVWNDFRSVPDKDLTKILACVERLGEDPRRQGAIKLSGRERYRFRYGKYRIIYSIRDEELTIWIVKVGHRKSVYR